jgi:hypothetical protein
MPKSRGRKNRRKTQRVTKRMIDARTREILEGQRQRFREKFGRDWQENDPVFFDPDASEPSPMSAVKMEADVIEAMRKAGTPPHIVYAYKKTGLLLMEEMREHWPQDRVKEWEDAVEEYFAIEDATKGVSRPNPEEWSTEIPEMLVSGFDQQDLEKVREILAAMAPIEGRESLKVIVRIELAAAFLATACSAAYDSAEPTGSPGKGPTLYAVTEDMVVKRAREIYGQGRG